MIKIIYEQKENRAAAYDDEKFIGESTYAKSDKVWIIDHTFVEKSYGGQGIAGRLVAKLVEEARKNDIKIIPLCSFAKREFKLKKEYLDVLLKEEAVMGIIKSLENRRTYYNIDKNLPVLEKEIEEKIKEVTELVPDAFNMKSARIVLAFGEKHDRLWDEIYNVFEGKVPREKIDSFKAGAGTVLFLYDEATVKKMQEQFSTYADNFPVWANQANGMLQLAVWSMLRELNVGASLQHYNPVIDARVKEIFDIPENFKLVAQMPFGGIVSEPDKKEKEDIKRILFDKLIAEKSFWSYDMTGIDMVSDEILILKTLIHLDMHEIDLLFCVFPSSKIKKVWREQMAIQGEYYYSLNLFLAWYYFDIKRPKQYLKTVETKHLNIFV